MLFRSIIQSNLFRYCSAWIYKQAIVDAIKEAGFEQVYIAIASSGMLEILYLFLEAGGKMGDIRPIKIKITF